MSSQKQVPQNNSKQETLDEIDQDPPDLNTSLSKNERSSKNVRELARPEMKIQGRDTIDSSVLQHSSTSVNMRVFLNTIHNKVKDKLLFLMKLLDANSESMIGFVELRGIQFVKEWLDYGLRQGDYNFVVKILRFLSHENLSMTYEALESSKIGRVISRIVKEAEINIKNEGKNRASNKNAPHNDLDQVCTDEKYRLASALLKKWKLLVTEWKMEEGMKRHITRRVFFADEKGMELEDATIFREFDAVKRVGTDSQRERMLKSTIPWSQPIELYESKSKPRMFETECARIENARIETEIEVTMFDSEVLQEPKALTPDQPKRPTKAKVPVIFLKPTLPPVFTPSIESKEERKNAINNENSASASVSTRNNNEAEVSNNRSNDGQNGNGSHSRTRRRHRRDRRRQGRQRTEFNSGQGGAPPTQPILSRTTLPPMHPNLLHSQDQAQPGHVRQRAPYHLPPAAYSRFEHQQYYGYQQENRSSQAHREQNTGPPSMVEPPTKRQRPNPPV